MPDKSKSLHIAIGAALFALCYFVLPQSIFSYAGRIALSTIAVMIYWWITQPVHIAVTALLPILINAVFGIVPMNGILAEYFSPTDVLLLGANFIVLAWIRTGLSKRIALLALRSVGTSVRVHILVWFVFSTILSAFLPNAVVAAALCPIAAAMIGFSNESTPGLDQNKTLYLILLAIVWGAGIGGFGTPLGGAMNLVAIKHIEAFTGQEYMYLTWTLKMLPYLVILAGGTCIYLMLIKTEHKKIPGTREFFKDEIAKIGKMSRAQVLSLALLCIAILLAFSRPLYQTVLPGFAPYYAFLLMGIIAFFLKGDGGYKLLTWDYAAKNVNWGLIILFSGGMAAGNMLVSSGAADAIANAMTAQHTGSIFLITITIVILGAVLSNASSNTAATAIIIPIVISIAAVKSISPLPLVYIAAAACNCAFVLPTSIRAIPVGYGLDIRFMFKKGLTALGVTLVLLIIAAFVNTGNFYS